MALHCEEDRNDLAWFQRRAEQMIYPPIIKSAVWVDINPFLGGGALVKALDTPAPYMRRFFAAAIA